MNLDNYTDYQLALKTIKGDFGNGQDRKNALCDRYKSVQAIVDAIMLGKFDGVYTLDEISRSFDALKPSDDDFDELKKIVY